MWSPEEATIGECFLRVAESRSRAVAIETARCSVSYGALRERAFAMAEYLEKAGADLGDRVILAHKHPEEMIGAILGTLIAGCVYVPVESALGRSRLDFIASDVAPKFLLFDADDAVMGAVATTCGSTCTTLSGIPPATDGGARPNRPTPMSVASILYTSGSTGTPKGVMQPHRTILYHMRALTARFGINQNDAHSLVAPFIFDASTSDMYTALLNGARLTPMNPRQLGDVALLAEMRARGVSLFHATPTLFRRLCAACPDGQSLASVRLVLLGGEPLLREDLTRFRRCFPASCLLVNGYGATETSGFVALQEIDDLSSDIAGAFPVGQPPDGISLSLRNEQAGRGDEGEVCVTSRFMGVGYWNAPEETATKFGTGRDGETTYRTGDAGSWTADGNLLLRGRHDMQVKVRGYRTDLAEIENILYEDPSVAHAAAVLDAGSERLVVFVTPVAEKHLNTPALQGRLARLLPTYLQPVEIRPLVSMPLTPTGKVDRRHLATLLRATEVQQISCKQGGNTATEQALGDLWSSVLGRAPLGVTDRFFDLGGDSMAMTRLQIAIERHFNVRVPLYKLYEFPTIRAFAQFLDETATNQTRMRVLSNRIASRRARRRGAVQN